MQEGFPKRQTIADRGYTPDFGGDGRYLYIPNRFDRTISVIDTASDTVVSTISLPHFTSGVFEGTWYRSTTRQIIAWQAATSKVCIIDANPASGTFNTVVDTYTVSSLSAGNHAFYDPHNDMLRVVSGPYGLNLKKRAIDAVPSLFNNISYYSCAFDTYFAQSHQFASGSTGGSISCLANVDTSQPVLNFRDGSTSFYASIVFKIKNSLYVSRGTPSKYSIINNEVRWDAVILTTMLPLAYDSKNNRLFCTGGTGGEGRVIDLSNFSDLGTVQARTRATNEQNNGFRAIYSEYSNKVYVYPFRFDISAAGCDRVHVYDLSLSLASSYLGYITVGNNCAIVSMGTVPAAKNRLYTTEFL